MNDKNLSPIQFMTLTAAAVIGVDVLSLQSRLAGIARQDAWISVSLAGLIVLIAGSVCFLLAKKYPDMDFPLICLDLGGKFLGRIFLVMGTTYTLLYLGLSLRIFAQALKMFLMDRTPLYILMLVMALAAGYAASKELRTIGTVVDIMFPITIITIAVIIILSIPQAEFIRLKPVMYNNTDNIIRGIIPSVSQFTGLGLILFTYSQTNPQKGGYLWYLTGMLIPIFTFIALSIISIMVFGPKNLVTLPHPTLTLLKAIQFPSAFLERLESFAAILWIGIVFNSASLFFYMSVRNTMVLFSVKEKFKPYIVWGHIPLLMAIAQFDEHGWHISKYMDAVQLMDTAMLLVFIPILTGYAFWKKRGENTLEKQK